MAGGTDRASWEAGRQLAESRLRKGLRAQGIEVPRQCPTCDAALAELRLGMSQANFESYLAGSGATAFDDDELTVTVPNPLVREALEQRFRQHVLRALFDVVSRPCRVRFVGGRARARAEELVAAVIGEGRVNGHAAVNGETRLEGSGSE